MAHVDDLITDARFYASQVLFGAGQAMGQAMNAITSLGAVGLPDDLLEGLNSLVPPLPPNPVAIPGYAGSRFDPADPPDGPPELIDPGDLQEPPEPGKPPDVRRYVAPPQPAQTVPNPSQIGQSRQSGRGPNHVTTNSAAVHATHTAPAASDTRLSALINASPVREGERSAIGRNSVVSGY